MQYLLPMLLPLLLALVPGCLPTMLNDVELADAVQHADAQHADVADTCVPTPKGCGPKGNLPCTCP